jgi:hypothetical protein
MDLKEFSKKLVIYSIVFLLYLSNTGLIYSVHTCIHSGVSVVELPSFSLEDDHCADVIKDSTCKEVQDDCCAKTATTEKKDCHTHHTKYEKADLVSVKPDPSFKYFIDYNSLVNFVYITDNLVEPIDLCNTHFIHYSKQIKDCTAESALDYRIGLNSFIC